MGVKLGDREKERGESASFQSSESKMHEQEDLVELWTIVMMARER